MNRFNIHEAPPIPQTGGLRAEPRHSNGRKSDQPSADLPSGISGRGVIRSTLKAGAGAAVILVLFVLPAEFGIDFTGVGRALGLKEMGEVKGQLAAEAAADEAAAATNPQIAARLDAIDAQLSDIAALLISAPLTPPQVAPVVDPAGASAPDAVATDEMPPSANDGTWRDDLSVVLAPGEGIEIKLAMTGGQIARFEWSANGGVLNHDTHGDGGGQNVTYAQGRGISGEVGELTANFTGNHGWFWRNRSDAPVTLTLRTGGQYSRFIQP